MSLLDNDVHAAGMLVSCHIAVGDEAAAKRIAQIAVARAEKAIAADQHDAGVLAGGSYSLAALGEAERAKAWMNRAAMLDPDLEFLRGDPRFKAMVADAEARFGSS